MQPLAAEAFTGNINSTSRLAISIPRDAATYQQVPVEDVMGTLIEQPDYDRFLLLWGKDGIL